MEPAEFIVKIIIIATICVGILGMIVESSQFEGTVKAHEKDRLAIDLAHALAATPCLAETIDGERRKGILLESKLEQRRNLEDCVRVSAIWSASITAAGKSWQFESGKAPLVSGSEGVLGAGKAPLTKKSITVAVKLRNRKVVPGKITVVVY